MPVFYLFVSCFMMMMGSMTAYVAALLGYPAWGGGIVGAVVALLCLSAFIEID